MDEHSDLPPRRRRVHEAERALTAAVRVALVPALGLPITIASAAASIAGTGLQLAIAVPLAVVAVAANLACWLKVVKRWRRLPRPGDDDQGWRRWWGDTPPSPLDPGGGPGGIEFNWTAFELQFWAYVGARERELVPA